MQNLRQNHSIVQSFYGSLREGDSGLRHAPKLLLRIINEGMWKTRIVRELGDKEVAFDRFEDFVTAQPLEGLGETMELIKRVCRDDPAALDAIDRATKKEPKDNQPVNNVNEQRPEGNTKQAALRKLRKDAPALHAEVLAGKLSPHGAMVKAGFRPKTVTIPLTVKGVTSALLKLSDQDRIAVCTQLLKDYQGK